MVRRATAADEEVVYQLVCVLEGEELPRQHFGEIYTSQQKDSRYIPLVWENGSGVLGFINLRLEGQLHHGGLVAEIVELVVDPACRGQGVGKALVEEGEKFARKQGCPEAGMCSFGSGQRTLSGGCPPILPAGGFFFHALETH